MIESRVAAQWDVFATLRRSRRRRTGFQREKTRKEPRRNDLKDQRGTFKETCTMEGKIHLFSLGGGEISPKQKEEAAMFLRWPRRQSSQCSVFDDITAAGGRVLRSGDQITFET